MSTMGPWATIPDIKGQDCDGGTYPPREKAHVEMPSLPSEDSQRRDEPVPPLRNENRGVNLARTDRGAVYGHPSRCFDRIARHWQAIFDLREPPSASLVALALASVKIARLTETPSDIDSQDDVDGYIECLRELSRPPGQKWHDLGLV